MNVRLVADITKGRGFGFYPFFFIPTILSSILESGFCAILQVSKHERGYMLFLIRGLPGSGKTTFADCLQDFRLVGANVSADDYFIDLQGNYNFDASKLKQAHEQCLDRTRLYLQDQYDVAVSNTFTTEKEMQPYFDLAEELDHDVTVLIVENRHGNKSVHNVPEDTVQKMKNRFSIKL